MGIVFGYLSLICFCILAAKWVARKCKLIKTDKFLMKIHKPAALLLTVFCILHISFVVPVLKNRAISVNVSGALAVAFILALIISCNTLKRKDIRMKWHRGLTILTAVCVVWHIAAYFADFKEYRRRIESITFKNIELSDIKDGTYIGEYDAGYIYAKAEVMIEDGKITSINLIEHRNERGKAAEAIVDNIIAEQKIDVDAISGATNSGNVIKKAIENAVTQ